MQKRIALLFIILANSLGGCGYFDSGTPWRGGPYALKWIDLPDEVWLEYCRPDGTSAVRIDPRVFAVGWDKRYLVAKQHPSGDLSVTNFFIIDASLDSPSASRSEVVRGPLSEAEFQLLSSQLKLPGFSKILASLQ